MSGKMSKYKLKGVSTFTFCDEMWVGVHILSHLIDKK